jgi:hypothetical protein
MSTAVLGGCNPGPFYKQWGFTVDEVDGNCGDLSNATAWINEQTGVWETAYFGTFNTPSDTSPSSSGSSSLAGGTETSPDIESFWVTDGSLARGSVLWSGATLYCIGYWCDGMNYDAQQSCIYSGVIQNCGSSAPLYDYELPLPPNDQCGDLATSCAAKGNYAMLYLLLQAADFATFVEECAEDPNCNASASPGACMGGDPFFGDPPP